MNEQQFDLLRWKELVDKGLVGVKCLDDIVMLFCKAFDSQTGEPIEARKISLSLSELEKQHAASVMQVTILAEFIEYCKAQ